MEHLANLFLAFALSLSPEEYRVTWHFSSPGCEGCFLQQISVMEKFYREGDAVVITTEKRDEGLEALSRMLRERFPGAEPDFRAWCKCEAPAMVTGFRIEDPASGESLTYNARQGADNPIRAQHLISAYRDLRRQSNP